MSVPPRARVTVPRAALLLLAAVFLAYARTLPAPFIFDDLPGIEQNASIRDWSDFGRVLSPPTEGGSGVAGRPLVNLSLAINHAWGGLDPWGYHLFNIAIHALATLTLFGLVRRLLLGPILAVRFAPRAEVSALAVSLLWAVHPLQTETVSCIMQRTEGLVGLFYLLTLYAFARATERAGFWRNPWAWAAVVCSLAGMATKEVMVTVPVLAWLMDRTFFAGTFAGAWRARRSLHGALALTWLLLLHLLAGNPMRGGTAGFTGAISVWENLLTQSHALALYLKLTIWPSPLVLDYGAVVFRHADEVLGAGLLVLVLLGATAWALWRKPVWGFLGAWFFVILAPSSSVIPLITQTIAEHRMYLPLAAAITLVVVPLAARPGLLRATSIALAAVVFLAATIARNEDYRSAEAIWQDNARKRPENPRSYLNLAELADRAGRPADAVPHYRSALALDPAASTARFKLALALTQTGEIEAALHEYAAAVQAEPAAADVRINFAAALVAGGQWADAITHYEAALRLAGPSPELLFNLGVTCARAARLSDAITHLGSAARLRPDHAETRYQFGLVLARANRVAGAAEEFRHATHLDPSHPRAWANLGSALYLLNRREEAVAAYEQAARLQPDDTGIRARLDYIRSTPP